MGVLKWTKSASDELDYKTRKLLCLHGELHPRADNDWLCITRLVSGLKERCAVYHYVLNGADLLLVSCRNGGS